jgi:hypothetical protein
MQYFVVMWSFLNHIGANLLNYFYRNYCSCDYFVIFIVFLSRHSFFDNSLFFYWFFLFFFDVKFRF